MAVGVAAVAVGLALQEDDFVVGAIPQAGQASDRTIQLSKPARCPQGTAHRAKDSDAGGIGAAAPVVEEAKAVEDQWRRPQMPATDATSPPAMSVATAANTLPFVPAATGRPSAPSGRGHSSRHVRCGPSDNETASKLAYPTAKPVLTAISMGKSVRSVRKSMRRSRHWRRSESRCAVNSRR